MNVNHQLILIENLNLLYLPKIYISTKNVSVDKPDIKRHTAKRGTELTNDVRKSPMPPDIVLIITAGKRPTRSAKNPKVMVPTTAPK